MQKEDIDDTPENEGEWEEKTEYLRKKILNSLMEKISEEDRKKIVGGTLDINSKVIEHLVRVIVSIYCNLIKRSTPDEVLDSFPLTFTEETLKELKKDVLEKNMDGINKFANLILGSISIHSMNIVKNNKMNKDSGHIFNISTSERT